ncbi:hypothetical protein LTR08_001157 [Meristemomyces frigidus]|nr:hypothetical protein LTR08_001157 [Meristemomyces frigidus]
MVAMFCKSGELARVQAPAATTFSVQEGKEFSAAELRRIVQRYRHDWRSCPESQLERRTNEKRKAYDTRRNQAWQNASQSAITSFVNVLGAQWPCETPVVPSMRDASTYISVDRAMSDIRVKFRTWHENRLFYEYLESIVREMCRLTTSEFRVPVLATTNAQRLPSFPGYISEKDLFSMPAPELPDNRHSLETLVESETRSHHFQSPRLQSLVRTLEGYAGTSEYESKYVADLKSSMAAMLVQDREPVLGSNATTEDLIACAMNLTWGKHMNVLESLVLVVQFAAFFLVLVLLAMASGEHTLSASFTFETVTGWPRLVGFLLGLSYCTGVLGGFDCATHLAEDTENARTEIPKSLLISTTVNSFSCIVVAILVTFCAGDANLLTGPLALSGHPLGSILQLFLDATRGNKSAACSVFALSAIIFAVCTVNTTATSSRMLFSLIRDGRDPFVSKLMAKDLNEEGLPRRCILIAAILPLVILWINFVSGVGFQAIVSQVTMALVITYFMVFACALDSRIYRPEVLGYAPNGIWQAGRRWGIVMDIIAMVFLFVVGLLCCLPYAPHPGAVGWNYAPFTILAVVLLGVIVWFVSARKHYRPGQEAYDRTAVRLSSSNA